MTAPLSFRQRDVLLLVAEGLTNRQIADHYGVTVSTAQRHVEDVRAKLGATNRANAVWVAAQCGLLPVGVAS